MRSVVVALLCILLAVGAGLAQRPVNPKVVFTDILPQSGITFRHHNGASPEKYYIETMGAGCGLIDYDNDGWPDVFVANGHLIDHIELSKPHVHYAQPKYLFRSTGKGTFVDVTGVSGAALSEQRVSRGVAIGDIDNDGDLDLVVSGCNEGPQLLRNDGGNSRPSLELKLAGVKSNRNGIGSQIKYQLGARTVHDQIYGGRSYESACDYKVFAGTGGLPEVKQLEIRWPSGTVDKIERLAAGAVSPISKFPPQIGLWRYGPAIRVFLDQTTKIIVN